MIIAMHQIQFMPGLRFFSKIKNCDIFVFLDDVQYEKREFQNRNKIKTANGWQYLTVPVLTKGKFYQKINEVIINNDIKWREEHLKTIKINYSKAKYFDLYYPEIENIYSKEYIYLKDISLNLINFFIKNFNIRKNIKFSSEFNISEKSTNRIIEICKLLKADAYLSGIGAKNYLDETLFNRNNIKLIWQNFEVKEYPQIYGNFMPNLSALDLLLNCGKDSLRYL